MVFTFHEIVGVGLFSSLIYGWNKFKNRERGFSNYDNIMITYKLNRYFNKSLKGIEKDYSKGKISDKDFFIEDDEVINYLLDKNVDESPYFKELMKKKYGDDIPKIEYREL